MTIQKLIDGFIRPVIGDGIDPTLEEGTDYQSFKYEKAFILDMMNETAMDIAKTTKFFRKEGYTLIEADTKQLRVPSDFVGLDDSTEVVPYRSEGIQPLTLSANQWGIALEDPLSQKDIDKYTKARGGEALPSSVLETLISQGLLGGLDLSIVHTQLDLAIFKFKYLYLPTEYTYDTVIEDRELRYLLRWGTAHRVLMGNLHNEALNLSKVYLTMYENRKTQVGTRHNWSTITTQG